MITNFEDFKLNETIINTNDDMLEIKNILYDIKPDLLLWCENDWNFIDILNKNLKKFNIEFFLTYVKNYEPVRILNRKYSIYRASYSIETKKIKIELFYVYDDKKSYIFRICDNENIKNNYTGFVNVILKYIEHEKIHYLQHNKIKNIDLYLSNKIKKQGDKKFSELEIDNKVKLYYNNKLENMAHARDSIKTFRTNISKENVNKILRSPFVEKINKNNIFYKIREYYKDGIIKEDNWKTFLKYCYMYNNQQT